MGPEIKIRRSYHHVCARRRQEIRLNYMRFRIRARESRPRDVTVRQRCKQERPRILSHLDRDNQAKTYACPSPRLLEGRNEIGRYILQGGDVRPRFLKGGEDCRSAVG